MTPLQKARKCMGWSLAELQKRLSCRQLTSASLSRIERGVQVPSAQTAAAIVHAFAGFGGLNELHVIYPQRFGDWGPGQTILTQGQPDQQPE